MRVQFVRDVTTRTRPEDRVHFKAGQAVDLSEASAQHWINRGAAKVAPPASEPKLELKPEPKPESKPEPKPEPRPHKQ